MNFVRMEMFCGKIYSLQRRILSSVRSGHTLIAGLIGLVRPANLNGNITKPDQVYCRYSAGDVIYFGSH